MRVFHASLEEAAGLHHLVAGIVDRGGRMIHTANDRVFVGVLGHAGKVLGNFDAGNVGLDGLIGAANLDRGIGLHVPGVELRRPADQEEHDAVGIFPGIDGALGFQGEHVVEPEAEHGEGAGMEKIPAAQAIAKFYGFVGIQPKHPDAPLRGSLDVILTLLFGECKLAARHLRANGS